MHFWHLSDALSRTPAQYNQHSSSQHHHGPLIKSFIHLMCLSRQAWLFQLSEQSNVLNRTHLPSSACTHNSFLITFWYMIQEDEDEVALEGERLPHMEKSGVGICNWCAIFDRQLIIQLGFERLGAIALHIAMASSRDVIWRMQNNTGFFGQRSASLL